MAGIYKSDQRAESNYWCTKHITLTHYTGYDPEVGAYVGTGSARSNQAIGIDFGRYPLTPMYTCNCKCKLLNY